MTVLKRNKLAATETCNRLATLSALLCKELPVTVGAVRLLVLGGELEAGELFTATGASEAFLVPGITLIRDSTTAYDFGTFRAALRILGLIAGHADYLIVTGDETLCTNRLFAFYADKTFLMPLLAAVLVLPHARLEDALAPITAGCKALVVTIGAVKLVVLRRKWTVRQRGVTGRAFETLFVPVPLFEGEILGVAANLLLTLFAGVRKFRLVAGQTMRLLVSEDVALTGQRYIATTTSKVACMVLLIHGTRIFFGKYEVKYEYEMLDAEIGKVIIPCRLLLVNGVQVCVYPAHTRLGAITARQQLRWTEYYSRPRAHPHAVS